MRRTLLHKFLLFGFLLLFLSGIAGTAHTKQASLSAQNTKTHHFSDGTESNGEIEIAASHTLTSAHHRTNIKKGSGSTGYTANNTCVLANTKDPILCEPTEQVHSRHLLLIFPFHYFW